MVLSKRERNIAVALAVIVALLVLFQYVYGPLFAWQTDLADQRSKINDQQAKDQRLVAKQHRLQKVWKDIMAGGLKADPSDAEGQLQQGLTDWARESGTTLASQRAGERPPVKNGFVQIAYQANGTGTTSQIAKLLWQIENTRIPVRIKLMQIMSRKDGTDDLQIHLDLSTLCATPAKSQARDQTKVVSATPAQEPQ